jgi:single-stranded DNA-binding protein
MRRVILGLHSFTNSKDEKVDATGWRNIEAWGKLAEIINQHCT